MSAFNSNIVSEACTPCVKVAYAGVNPIDWKLFSGGLDGICPCQFPYTPGFDVSGTISAVGEGVTGFAVGDEVAGDIGLVESCSDPPAEFGPAGAFAEYATLPASLVVGRCAAVQAWP